MTTTELLNTLIDRSGDKVPRQLDELQYALAVIDYKITTYGGACSD